MSEPAGSSPVAPDTRPAYGDALLPQHAERLAASGITEEVARSRGYVSARSRDEVLRLGFAPQQAHVPALVVPIRDVNGAIVTYQCRPDVPRRRKGRPIKYETRSGSRLVLDVPTGALSAMADPTVPLFITEGARKADAAVSKGLACIALLGVWGWRGKNNKGGKAALSDWEAIALNNRKVYIAFDSDVTSKLEVRAALTRLRAFLESRGARVHVLHLPQAEDGSKVGLDDFLARHSVDDLLALEATESPAAEAQRGTTPLYRATPDGIIFRKRTAHGEVDVWLSNFTAKIVEEIIEDDGTNDEPRGFLEIEVHLGERTSSVRVPTAQYRGMNWVMPLVGPKAIVYPGQAIADHLRTAIQILSPSIRSRRIYTHTGWRRINDQWAYLHAGGGLGGNGPIPNVEVRLPDALARCALPTPAERGPLAEALRASMRILDLGPPRVVFPAYAAIWRAALRSADFGLHLAGPTGVFKTELAALLQAHWGREINARCLPGSWSSTGNATEGLAFAAKDALLVVDDFAPTGSAQDIARMHREADRLLRAQGNQAGRMRMRADTTLRPAKPPRSLIVSTGEEIPRGQSLRARFLVGELGPNDIDVPLLTACQRDAADGLYAAALAGFVGWVAPRYDMVRATWATSVEFIRNAATRSHAHRRTAAIVANLACGFAWFLEFASDVRVVSEQEIDILWAWGWDALGAAAAAQIHHHEAAEPTRRFRELLAAALMNGQAHLAGLQPGPPRDPSAWGWTSRTLLPDVGPGSWQPKGACIGWVDEHGIYLQPDAAYAAAQRLAQTGGESLTVGLQILKKRLHEKDLLASTDARGSKLRYEVRRTIAGQRRTVLHFATTFLGVDEMAQVAQGDVAAREDRLLSWATVRDTLGTAVAQPVAQPSASDSVAMELGGPSGPPVLEHTAAGTEADETAAPAFVDDPDGRQDTSPRPEAIRPEDK